MTKVLIPEVSFKKEASYKSKNTKGKVIFHTVARNASSSSSRKNGR